MEIKIDIPKNDWTQPTEVRQEVVQGICNILLRGSEIRVYDHTPVLVLVTPKTSVRYPYLDNRLHDEADEDWTRVHGVEVNAAFKALREAGYYLYGSYCITDGEHTYGCSKTPYHKGMECTIKHFGLFID